MQFELFEKQTVANHCQIEREKSNDLLFLFFAPNYKYTASSASEATYSYSHHQTKDLVGSY